MRQQTSEEWMAEGERRFGEDFNNWKFECPACGNVHSVKDFKDLGLDPNLTYQECIGRHVKDKGCDWCSYGFLGTLGHGRIVTSKGNHKSEVFDFAIPASEIIPKAIEMAEKELKELCKNKHYQITVNTDEVKKRSESGVIKTMPFMTAGQAQTIMLLEQNNWIKEEGYNFAGHRWVIYRKTFDVKEE
jgi:hypothetical protein